MEIVLKNIGPLDRLRKQVR